MSDILSVLKTVAITAFQDAVDVFLVLRRQVDAGHFLQQVVRDILSRFHGTCDLDAEGMIRHLQVRSVFIYQALIFCSQ